MTKIEWTHRPRTTGVTWKQVPGYADYYVTSDGQIRGPAGKVMKQMEMPTGHLYILCNRGRGRQRKLFVHRAVLLAFVGEPKDGEETRHMDGDPANNHLENLAWGTHKDNVDDRRRHGRMPIPHESRFTKLHHLDIPIIRTLQHAESSRTVAAMFNTSHTTIQKIWRGERWKGY